MPAFDIEAVRDADPAAIRLQTLLRRALETCPPQTPVRRALETMRDRRIGAMVVVNESGIPLGILTLRDVVDRVALEHEVLAAPIEQVMTRNPVGLSSSATAYEAARLMVRAGVRHVVVLDPEGRASGIVSERDLFGMQTTGVRHLSLEIRGAQDVAQVQAFGAEIHGVARSMLRQGAAVGPLTAFISSLIDLLTERIVQLEVEREDPPCDICWLVMGSEGRSEQTLSTDQDNGIVFRPREGWSPDAVRERLLPLARRINAALDRAGYRLCPGDIMAGNPQWCATLDEWRTKFSHWIDSGSPDALLHGAIFFDLRGLAGDVGQAAELRAWIVDHARRNPRFLHQMAANAMRSRPALGRWARRFEVDPTGRIDLKMHGATPFIDAARIMSLAAGVDEVGTEPRLRSVARSRGIATGEAESWIAAFHHVQGLRLQHQAGCLARGTPPDNLLLLADLHEFNQRLLRAALEQARDLQRRLALDHGL